MIDYLISKEDWKNAFEENNLIHLWVKFESLFLPEIRLHTVETNDIDIEIGKSKTGGYPDMNQSDEWPLYPNGDEIPFIAQINIGDLNTEHIQYRLPENGMLYFFYSFEEKYHRIIYTNEVDQIDRRKNKTEVEIHNSREVILESTFGLPSLYSDMFPEGLTQNERSTYFNIHRMSIKNKSCTKLFGHPYFIHGSLESACERKYRLSKLDFPSQIFVRYEILNAQKEDMELQKNKWKLLLQIDDEANMDWLDLGIQSFWIIEKDLENSIFNEVQAIFDNY